MAPGNPLELVKQLRDCHEALRQYAEAHTNALPSAGSRRSAELGSRAIASIVKRNWRNLSQFLGNLPKKRGPYRSIGGRQRANPSIGRTCTVIRTSGGQAGRASGCSI